MGIVNVTPDSFSDGGRFLDRSAAIDHALELAGEGADIVDVGGESTRPGSESVSEAEEMRRVIPVIEGIRARSGVPISIDTTKSAVADAALQAGADIINDVSALRSSPRMAKVAAERGAPVILMHMLGTPKTMQAEPRYGDVVAEVSRFLSLAIERAVGAGVERTQVAVDPGIGFGKTVEHNLKLIAELGSLKRLGVPVVVGASRKSFLGSILGADADSRLEGTLAVSALAVAKGASIIRVHDVAANRRAIEVAWAVVSADGGARSGRRSRNGCSGGGGR
jgi:dihydropteroate synthase